MSNISKHHQIIERIKARWDDFFSRSLAIEFKSGQMIFYENHQPTGVYLLARGSIALRTSQNSDKTVMLVADEHPVIGMDFLLAGIPYPFSAQAIDDVTVAFLTRTDFADLFDRQPSAPLPTPSSKRRHPKS